MKLSYSYEKTLRGGQIQEIDIVSKEVNSRGEAAELNYPDFDANLYINGKFVADISHVLAKMPIWEDLIDATDWEELYCDMKAELPNH